MPPRKLLLIASTTLAFTVLSVFAQSNWPQFRGPDSRAVAAAAKPPIHFGPTTNLLWKVPIPLGHSSPCVWSDRVFLTAFENGKLETFCIDRRDGKTLWRATAPAEKIEPVINRLGSPAAPSPAADGERVYVYFGSFGLISYDFSGREVWRRRFPIPMVEFGAGSSPIVAGELVILLCDQDLDSFLLAVNRRTGEIVWKTARPESRRGFSTPYIWRHDGMEEVVVTGTVWLKGYALKDGKELWKTRGLARVANASPTSGDGLLFASSWNIGGDARDHLSLPSLTDFSQRDKDKNGKFTKDEFPTGPLLDRFTQIDLDKDGFVTPDEWHISEEIFAKAENALFAVRPGGHGDISETHVAWKQTRGLPYVPSPLFYDGRIYVIKNGGMVSCYEAKTGRILYQEERLGALGDYYSSPVAADGKVYFISQQGVVTVLQAGDVFHVLARNEFDEPILATPAIVDGSIFVRTAGYLSNFGEVPRGNSSKIRDK